MDRVESYVAIELLHRAHVDVVVVADGDLPEEDGAIRNRNGSILNELISRYMRAFVHDMSMMDEVGLMKLVKLLDGIMLHVIEYSYALLVGFLVHPI